MQLQRKRHTMNCSVQRVSQSVLGILGMLAVLSSLPSCKKDPPDWPLATAATPGPAAELGYATLVSAVSTPGINIGISGLGNSGTMLGRVRNDTEEHWTFTVETGTKFEPKEGDVQSMVVTEELEVSVDKYETQEFSIEVACLDISKAPPSPTDLQWTVSTSPQLAAFIGCANEYWDEKARSMGLSAEESEVLGTNGVQFGVWQARGASQDDWVHFYVEYGSMTESEARGEVEAIRPLLDELTARCHGL